MRRLAVVFWIVLAVVAWNAVFDRVLIDAGLFHLLVHRRGWTQERFQAWLADTMQRQLLG
jgi:hypothetical protein